MVRKASYCDLCKHWSSIEYETIEDYDHKEQRDNGCAKGHQPRFYLPTIDHYYAMDYGWKRRCDDFAKDRSK